VSHDFLPDSRARDAKDVIRSTHGNLVQLFCANCGVPYGRVPEGALGPTFAFALCQPCADKWGPIAHLYMEPDSVFWERVRVAQAEQEIASDLPGLLKQLDDPSSVASMLAADWLRHVEASTR
jgi:hypothetical protein